MSYAQIHDTFPLDEKMAGISDTAVRVYVYGLVYVQKQKTDGFIPDRIVPILGFLSSSLLEAAQELVAKRAWDRVDGGYQIHNYTKWNWPAAKRDAKNEKNARHQAAWKARQKAAGSGAEVVRSALPLEPVDPPSNDPPRTPRGPSLTVPATTQMADDARYGFRGPRFRVPIALHQDLLGRYGAEYEVAEPALQKWYRALEASLLQGESIPNIYDFIHKHFAAWVASRAAKTPMAPTVKRADDQRQGVTDDFRAQLEAANERRVKG